MIQLTCNVVCFSGTRRNTGPIPLATHLQCAWDIFSLGRHIHFDCCMKLFLRARANFTADHPPPPNQKIIISHNDMSVFEAAWNMLKWPRQSTTGCNHHRADMLESSTKGEVRNDLHCFGNTAIRGNQMLLNIYVFRPFLFVCMLCRKYLLVLAMRLADMESQCPL